MRDQDLQVADRTVERAERALIAIGGAAILLGAVYVIGMSGLPGEALTSLIDWAISQHAPSVGATVRQALAA